MLHSRSDRDLVSLLKRVKATDDPARIAALSDEIFKVIFHVQIEADKGR